MAFSITKLSNIAPAPYPLNTEPYPSPESNSSHWGLQVFDLITPDGDRVWVTAGWDDDRQLRAWPIKDFLAERPPSKAIPDSPKRFAPLVYVNASAGRREQFIADYMALNESVGQQDYHLGVIPPAELAGWVGKKIYPHGDDGREHVVKDYDDFYRTLIVDNRSGGITHVDILDVTASWHEPYTSKKPVRAKQAVRNPEQGQYLYRLYNKGGGLLYVGITTNCFRRWKEHSKEKDWWGQVHQFTQDWYPDRCSVELAERHAIALEAPIHNKAHNRGGA